LPKKLGHKPLVDPSPSKEEELLNKTAAGIQVNMPNAKPRKTRPYNAFEQHFMGEKTGGLTYPNNTVAINMKKAKTPDDMTDLLVHEYTHTGQKPRSLWQSIKEYNTPPGQRPDEREAEVASVTYKYRSKGRDTRLK
jgi:hypothetical protein